MMPEAPHTQDKPDHLPSRVKVRIKAARALLVMAEGLAALLPAIIWAGAFISAALVDVPGVLPYGDIIFPLVFWAGLISFLIRAVKTYKHPPGDKTLRYLEHRAGLDHRPLTGVQDSPVPPGGGWSKQLWQRHMRGIGHALRKLPWPAPPARLAYADPIGLRFAVGLALVCAVVMAAPGQGRDLMRAFLPWPVQDPQAGTSQTVIQVVPPDYTGLPSFSFPAGDHATRAQDPVVIVESAALKINAAPGFFTPVLEIGELSRSLTPQDGGDYALEIKITPELIDQITRGPGRPAEDTTASQNKRGEIQATLRLVRGLFTGLEQKLQIRSDRPPAISLRKDPHPAPDSSIRLPLQIKDDYGVTRIRLQFDLDEEIQEPPLGNPGEVSRPLPAGTGAPDGEALDPAFHLQGHNWAGLPVRAKVFVTDHAGHTGKSDPFTFILPERDFTHPVAKNLVQWRKELIWSPLSGRDDVADKLGDVLIRPGSYDGDIVVFLGLKSATARLGYPAELAGTQSVVDLLWDLALRLEDGSSALALEKLRQAAEDLTKTLQDPDATREDIARATEKFRTAMARFQKSLMRDMMKYQDRQIENALPENARQNFDSALMQDFLEQMRENAMQGDRAKALEMLNQMNNFLNQLSGAKFTTMPENLKKLDEAVSDLQDIVDDQEALLGQSEKLARGGDEAPTAPSKGDDQQTTAPGLPPQPQAGESFQYIARARTLQDRQMDIVEDMNALLDKGAPLGKAQDKLGQARGHMQDSVRALGRSRLEESLQAQRAALDKLKDAGQSMRQALQKQLQRMVRLSLGAIPRDPLGRPRPGSQGLMPGGEDIEIPASERKRIDEILDTLRERSGEMDRPLPEREYYKRLLHQW